LPPSLALSEVINLVDRVKMVQGEFSLIFHNSSFYPREGWTGWEELYREVISYAKA